MGSQRALTIDIEVDDSGAQAAFKRTDQAIEKIQGTAAATGGELNKYEQTVLKVVKAKDDLARASGSIFDKLEATRTAVKENSNEMQELFTWVDRTRVGGIEPLILTLKDWRQGLNDMAEGLGLTVANLGLMTSGFLALGTLVGSFKLTTTILQFTGLDKAIGDATVRLWGWAQAAQTAGAQQDAIALAYARGGVNINNAADALRYNTQWVKNQMEALKDLHDQEARQGAYAMLGDQIADWRGELDRLQNEGVLDNLKDSLQTQLFSTKQLSEAYHVSEGAISLLNQRLKDETAASKAAADAAKRRADDEQKASDDLMRAWARADAQFMVFVNHEEAFARKVESEQSWPFPKMTGDVQKLAEMFPPLTNAAKEFTKETNEWGDGIIKQLPKLQTSVSAFRSVLSDVGTILSGVNGRFVDLANIGIRTTESVLDHLAKGEVWQAIVAGVSGAIAAISKLWDKFKEWFGGPSADELAGRDIVAKFENNLHTMLTAQEQVEAGNDSWKQTVIAVRDAYLKMGLTEQQALTDVKALWDSSRSGPEAVAAIIKLITDRMNGLTAAAGAAADAIGGLGDNTNTAPTAGETMHRGGMVLPFVPRAHRGLAVDEVPIIAQTGEGILNRGAMRRIGGTNGLNRLNAGGSGGGHTFNVSVKVDGDLNSLKARQQAQRGIKASLQSLMLERRKYGAA